MREIPLYREQGFPFDYQKIKIDYIGETQSFNHQFHFFLIAIIFGNNGNNKVDKNNKPY